MDKQQFKEKNNMKNISYYKDEDLSYLFNYQFSSINDNSKDTGFIVRTIELYRLSQMKDKIKWFSELTNFDFDNLMPSLEEIKLLIKQGESIVSTYSKLSEKETAELNSLTEYMSNLENGKLKKPAHEPTARSWAESAYRAMERQQCHVKSENDKLNKINGLYGLLKPVIEWMISEKVKGIKSDLLNALPNQQCHLNSLISDMNWGHEQSCKFILDEMSAFEQCIDNIISNCTLPKDPYALRNTPTYRIEYYKHYYSNKEPHLKEILTAKEFSESMVNAERRLQQKLKYL
ncbi:hypothetical protein AB7W97_15460 [Providencia rettgeri]|uniref:hypothetical protein n=1 Tax=Providencia TaxID=586 RepID=UPI0023494801|nr:MULTISPECIES: hypothetical protein [unclassified Providencia]MDK3107119.1 hypothetical protein [Providencia rettgeri]WRR98622.1 hypothetical protein VNI59_07730 [Providencia rettgeri]